MGVILNMPRKCLSLLMFLLIACFTQAQENLKGVIRSAQTELPMENVAITNLTSRRVTLSDKQGRYSIAAAEDDTVIFSITAYVPDTLRVSYGMLITNYDPVLVMNMVALRGVTVRSNYQLDSLNRAIDYRQLKGSMRGITGNNRPTDGVGVSISPLSYFSKRAKEKRRTARQMEDAEEQFYIDEKFSVFTVARLTRLSGDSLNLFMYMYRPTYKQARKMDRDDVIEYVSDKLILFRKRRDTTLVATDTIPVQK